MTWLKNVEKDCEMVGLGMGGWCEESKDRNTWRGKISYITSVKKKYDFKICVKLV